MSLIRKSFYLTGLLSLLCSILFINESTGQSLEVKGTGIDTLHLDFYRALIRVSTSEDNAIHYDHKIYDYNRYMEEKKRKPHDDGSSLRTLIKDHTLNINNPASRNLQFMDIKVPNHISLKLNIRHYGELDIISLDQPLEATIFRGKIHMDQVKNSVNASVVRDGNISVKITTDEAVMVALSTYNGDLEVRLPSQADADFLLNTERGMIVNHLGVDLSVFKNSSEKKSDVGRTGLSDKPTWYKATLNQSRHSSIILKNVRGKIILEVF